MRFEWLTKPVSSEEPCGPDLEATDDGAFVDYYYEAESRMPERYFLPGIKEKDSEFVPGTLFDPKSISHADEFKTITGLLERSRDLRLLSLLARLMILAGRLPDFADALEGIAMLLETFPEDVHPHNVSDRRGALDELGGSSTVLLPLQYANVGGPGEVSLRRHKVATGAAEPREGEVGLNAGTMISDIAAPGNKDAVEQAHDALNRAANALQRITSQCMAMDPPFKPNVSETMAVIADVQTLIHNGRGDLPPWAPDGSAKVATEAKKPVETSDAAKIDNVVSGPPVRTAEVTAANGSVKNHAEALQSLKAIETYLATHEPAAPSLLLVTQARLLVGRPLVEAIETLLPEHANKTKITFGSETGFVIYMDRLKMLASEGAGQAAPAAEHDPGPPPVIENRASVAPLLTAVEEYFRTREPASPIPVLLFKARTYLDKDFTAIVADLLPQGGDV